MRMHIKYITAAIILLMLLAGSTAAADEPTVAALSKKLSCQCGTCPNLPLYSCQCGTAQSMREDVAKMIDAGMSEDAIIDNFVERYGEIVLAAPKAEGFNITAWLLPIGGVLLFGVFLLLVLSRWTFARAGEGDAPEAPRRGEDKAYTEKLDRELDDV